MLKRYVIGMGRDLVDTTLMPWSEDRMNTPYIRDDTLNAWIVFPSEQLRRAYVQAASIIRASHRKQEDRAQRLAWLCQACDGVRQEQEPV